MTQPDPSTTTGGTTTGTTGGETSTAQPAKPEQQPAKTEPDWKAEARKHEQRAKDNADKARQYDALQEAAKTEAQRQADALAAAQRERDTATTQLLRYEVAAAAGLDAKLAKYLPHGTREQMAEAAEELLHATALQTGGRTPARPVPDPSQGGTGQQQLTGAALGLAEAHKRFGAPKT